MLADAALNGTNGIKDSASSAVSGEIGMQPYIKRNQTDESGYILLPFSPNAIPSNHQYCSSTMPK